MDKPNLRSFIPSWMKEGTTFLFHLKDEPKRLIYTAKILNHADSAVLTTDGMEWNFDPKYMTNYVCAHVIINPHTNISMDWIKPKTWIINKNLPNSMGNCLLINSVKNNEVKFVGQYSRALRVVEVATDYKPVRIKPHTRGNITTYMEMKAVFEAVDHGNIGCIKSITHNRDTEWHCEFYNGLTFTATEMTNSVLVRGGTPCGIPVFYTNS